jgi:hypothetical protein
MRADGCMTMVGKLPTLPNGPPTVGKLPTLRARPFWLRPAGANIPVDRRIGPIDRPLDQSVLHRIAPAIGQMRAVVSFVADHVFPEPPLPEAAFALGRLARGSAHLQADGMGKPRLDLPPPGRIVRVPFRQGPDRMQMVRQNHHRIAPDRVLRRRPRIGGPQQRDMVSQDGPPATGKVDGEEIAGSGNPDAAVARHADSVRQDG